MCVISVTVSSLAESESMMSVRSMRRKEWSLKGKEKHTLTLRKYIYL